MTQNEKDLLLKDLCARLPYGVKVDVIDEDNEHHITEIGEGNIGHLGKGFWKDCKPYLFPLSSMTREQEREWQSLMVCDIYGIFYHTIESFDYLYKNHIDIRGLIPMGLAKDATELNIY
jgi:hypothetical protein